MAIDLVRHPGTLGVKSPPDRSVSLPDARDTAVSMMGFGGVGGSAIGNLRLKQLQRQRRDLVDRYEALAPDAPGAPFDQDRDTLLDEIDEVERLIREEEPPDEPPPSAQVEVADVSDPAVRKMLLERLGGRHLDPAPDLPPNTAAMSVEDWQPGDIPDATEGGYAPAPGYKLPPHPWPPLQPLPGDPPPITSNGHGESLPPNTAAMVAEGEPPRWGRSAPEGPTAPYEPLPELTEEEKRRALEELEKIRKEKEAREKGRNPESRMDAQFLPDLFAQMAEQENRGYFGDVGEFVGSMSTEQKIALLIAAGVLTAGASTPMLGAALAGGAGLAFANQ